MGTSKILKITSLAEKDLRKLPDDVRMRIGRKLHEYAQDPLVFSRKLINSKIGNYRFRIGDYRVIFDIVGDDLVILRVGNRKEVYK